MDASRERYKFNTTKTKTVSINSKNPPQLLLNKEPLESSKQECHVGILRSSKNTNKETINNRIKKARQTSYSLMGAGMHGLNGTGPMVAAIQYTTYVLPTLLYGLESLILSGPEVESLEQYHRKNLRFLQHLPQSTANCALFLLLGQIPIEAQIHIKILTFFRNILDQRNDSSPSVYTRDLITRQLATQSNGSSSWVIMVKSLLRRYELPSAFSILSNVPSKPKWKTMVKESVHHHWSKLMKDEAEGKSSLEYMNINLCEPGKLHPVWRNVSSQLDILKSTVKAQLLVKRYPLTTSPTSGAKKSDVCPLCGDEPETTAHFLLHCRKLQSIRDHYLPHVMETIRNCRLSIDTETVVRVILDSSHIEANVPRHEQLCRNFVFKLHHKRTIMLGGSSRYSYTKN